MSRTTLLILLGVGASLMVGIMTMSALLLGRSYFMIADRDVQALTPLPTVGETAVVESTQPATTQPADPTTSTTSEAATAAVTAPPTATAVPATAISVLNTTVRYIMAQTDVNIRSGPGTDYHVIGWVAEGQAAKVTGINSNNSWWRVVCPDGSTGSCWVTALSRYTQPTTAPGSQPSPTATSTACRNAATFVADITVPDGSQIVAKTSFVKTWRIKNSGTCIWDGRYHLVHVSGPQLEAVPKTLQLPASVAPGQTVDLSIIMLAPVPPGSYQNYWKLLSPQGTFFGVGSNDSPLWLKINVISQSTNNIISGVIFRDLNQNGIYDGGETLVPGQAVWLVPGTACHVQQNPAAVTYSGADGRYIFSGDFIGNYCVGLAGANGLEDGASITLSSGQTRNNINLKSHLSNGSISGYLWNDYCLTNNVGQALAGHCVVDGNGDVHADGIIQPNETYISGATILLQRGACGTNNPQAASTTTDNTGKYTFANLLPGTYCVFTNDSTGGNPAKLLPGDWTFPGRGIWYHEITIRAGEQVTPVNFGWDFQLQ